MWGLRITGWRTDCTISWVEVDKYQLHGALKSLDINSLGLFELGWSTRVDSWTAPGWGVLDLGMAQQRRALSNAEGFRQKDFGTLHATVVRRDRAKHREHAGTVAIRSQNMERDLEPACRGMDPGRSLARDAFAPTSRHFCRPGYARPCTRKAKVKASKAKATARRLGSRVSS